MVASAFLSATNHLLAQSGWARARLTPHAGCTARLELAPLTSIDFSVSADGHFAEWVGENEPDVVLRMPVAEMPRLLVDGLESSMRLVRIEGNADFADALGFVFRHLRWDVEEDLSRVLGDIAAHRLVDTGRRIGTEGRRSIERARGNVVEYLTEESLVLVPRTALPAHAQEVAALRDALGRLDKRVARLERGRQA